MHVPVKQLTVMKYEINSQREEIQNDITGRLFPGVREATA